MISTSPNSHSSLIEILASGLKLLAESIVHPNIDNSLQNKALYA